MQLHQYVSQCTLHDGRQLYLVNDGYPVNFTGASVPDEIVEILFAELIMLVPHLLDRTPAARQNLAGDALVCQASESALPVEPPR